MKTSNKLLIGGLVFILLSSLLAIGGVSYVVKHSETGLIILEYEPLVIDRKTTQHGLDSLQRVTEEAGGKLAFSEASFMENGDLDKISGRIEYPCCTATFDTDSLEQIIIGKGTKKLQIWVNPPVEPAID